MNLKPHYFNKELFFNFVRCSELIMVFIHLFNGLIYGSNLSFMLSNLLILNSYLNYILKNYFSKTLFKLFNNYIPILGLGSRPEGAYDCGYFTSCPSKKAISFGFPSGHSQFAGIHSGFLIKEIIVKKSKDATFNGLNASDKMSVILLFSYIPIMMFSRVYIEKCHTIEQTIFGSLIGFFIGYSSYDFYQKNIKTINRFFSVDSAITKVILFFLFIYVTLYI